MMSDKERIIRQRLKDDFEHYASRCLRIRTKEIQVVPFQLNQSQRYIHQVVEEQRAKTGRVRAIILKGRQQGCSTYVEGRFYWRVTHLHGARAFILTHEDEATKNLFDMAQRYHDNCHPLLKPTTKACNQNELLFGELDSGYKVGTARNKGVGRSSTIQFFHGSEVAFWQNAQEHAKGIMQAIPKTDGTEIFLESTANGVGNYFYQQWQKALAKETEYVPIFIPWFWQDEYRCELPEDFTLEDEEKELKALYKLDDQQLAWRRVQISELNVDGKDGERAFKQEYPCNAAEAFQTSGDSLIPSELVAKARKTFAQEHGSLVIGIDPAFGGNDRTAIVRRRGRVAYNLEVFEDLPPMQLVGKVVQIIKEEKPDKIFMDISGATGHVDRLHEMGYRELVMGVSFGSASMWPDKYPNKRSEMWCQLLEWLRDEPSQIPDSDILHTDLCAPQREGWLDSKGRVVIEPKESLKRRGMKSPDSADALALTFAFPVALTTQKKIVYPPLGLV
jgi:hypothetical protein